MSAAHVVVLRAMVRRILITGANKGIGLAIARRCLLDHDDTHVVLGCRSLERGSVAVESLVAEMPACRARLSVLQMDTSSDASVKAAAAKCHGSEPFYALCNNAGIASGSVIELFEVNTYGPRRVDDAFLPLLDKKVGRIVMISSGSASQCVQKCSPERQRFFVDDQVTWAEIEGVINEVKGFPNGAKDLGAHGLGTSMGCYGLTKALLNSYTVMIAREHPNLKINACSPGMIQTDLFNNVVPWFMPRFLVGFLARTCVGAKTPDEGTVAPMALLFNELEGNGRYYGSDATRSPLDKYRAPGSPPYEGP